MNANKKEHSQCSITNLPSDADDFGVRAGSKFLVAVALGELDLPFVLRVIESHHRTDHQCPTCTSICGWCARYSRAFLAASEGVLAIRS